MKKYALLLSVLLLFSCESKETDINYGLVPVSKEKYYGYIDLQGNYVINPQFVEAGAFRDGLAHVVNKQYMHGFIGVDGNYLINPNYSDVTIFNEGIAWVREIRGFPMAIDKKGNKLFDVKEAHSVSMYSDGLAAFEKKEKDHTSRFGYLDTKGKVAIPAQFFQAGFFCNGLAAVANEDYKYGYINKKGELVIDYQFDKATPFIDNKNAIVAIDNLYGVIDKKGKFVISPQFAEMVQDGDLYIVSFNKNGDRGFCDTKGKIVVNPQFSRVAPFCGTNFAPVQMSSGNKMGYVNKKGLFVLHPQYDWASSFFVDYAFVKVDGKFGIIDQTGKYIVNPQFTKFSNDFFVTSYDLLYMGSFYPYMVNARMDTDYLDVDKIVEAFKQLLVDGKLDGMPFPPSVEDVLTRYSLQDKSVPVYDYWTVSTINLTEYSDITLYLDGYFYDEVSDGWWGHKSVLNKKAKATRVFLTLKIQDITGYGIELEDAFEEEFNGRLGDFKISVETEGLNAINITLSK